MPHANFGAYITICTIHPQKCMLSAPLFPAGLRLSVQTVVPPIGFHHDPSTQSGDLLYNICRNAILS